MNKLTTLLATLLLVAVAIAGYMTYKNRLLTSTDTYADVMALSEQIAALKSNNADLTSDADITALSKQVAELTANLATTLTPDMTALSKQITTLKANNEQLSADLTLAKSNHAEQLRQDIETLKQNMEAELSKKDGVIKQLHDTATAIPLDTDVVFELGSTNLSASGKKALLQVTQLVEKYPNYLISLEGHTDNIPISTEHQDKFPSNWELSSARAARAARFLESRGIDSLRLRIVGYGLSRPIIDNSSEQNRARNRRLEIRFSPKLRIGEPL